MVHERDYLPWRQFLDNLAYFESRIETKPVYIDYKHFVGSNGPTKEFPDPLPADGSRLTPSRPSPRRRRRIVLEQLFTDSEMNISTNVKTVIYDAGIKYGSEEDWEMMWDAYLKETDASEKRKLIHALATTRDSNLLVRFLNYGLNESTVRCQDTSAVVSSVTNNPGGQVLAWRFFQQHWDIFHKRYAGLSFILSGLIKSTASRFDTEFDYSEVKNFFGTRDAGSGKRAVQQVLETIQMNIDWLKSHEHDVTVWLKNH